MSKIEFEGTMNWQLNAIQSFNYQYFFIVLKTLFFEHNLFELCIDDETTSEVLAACAKIVAEESGLPLDEDYLELKHYFSIGEDNSRSIIIEYEFPFPIETECKFAALVKDSNGEKFMYTSEFYEWSGVFKLCETKSDGDRFSYSYVTNTLYEFLEAINHKIN